MAKATREIKLLREPPKTTFRSWVEGDGSVFGVAVFMVTLFVGVFLTLIVHG
jgi:hypothetical protein